MHTSNAGIIWIVEGGGLSTAFLRGVHFISPTSGYVVGNDKTLLKYTEISGIEDKDESIKFELFPNPAGDEFRISSSEFRVSGATVEIYNLNGKKRLEKHIPKGTEEFTVDINHLQSGIYFCRIMVGNKSVTKKLIIKQHGVLTAEKRNFKIINRNQSK